MRLVGGGAVGGAFRRGEFEELKIGKDGSLLGQVTLHELYTLCGCQ